VDNDGSYFCDCHDFEKYIEEEVDGGTGTWTCIDKDECSDPAWNGCDDNSACINLDPSYECDCNEGRNKIQILVEIEFFFFKNLTF